MPEEHNIPISVVELGQEVEDLLLEVVRSGVIAQGPMVKRLEATFAEMIGVDHVVAVNNGTSALIASLQVLNLEPGDEVITSPFTFVATLNAILEAGATARFADITVGDFNVTAESLAPRINQRTKVLMPVHLYGQSADMSPIADLAAQHGLDIVEDAAQAHGATDRGRSAGTWGIGCFSLYATKNLTCGEGGLISTNDSAIADRLRIIRNQGMRQRYEYVMAGNNYRLTDVHAAICIPQIARYADLVQRRQANAEQLIEGLADVEWLRLPLQQPGRGHVWHQFTVLVEEGAPSSRDDLVSHLTAAGVGCGVYYPKLVHDYDCYRSNPKVLIDETPIARRAATQCLSLPVHPHLTDADISRIVATVKCFGGSRSHVA